MPASPENAGAGHGGGRTFFSLFPDRGQFLARLRMKTPENQIGPWSVDPASGELRKGTVSRRLEPKSLDLLLLLAREPGRVFTREEIFAAVWPGVTVADDTLARAVSKLRKALDDDPKAPRFIETLPKRGYRLIAAPETVGTVGHSRRWPALAAGVVALALAVAGAAIS